MFESQIETGASLLYKKVPGWIEMQDLEVLDLSDTYNCVVGQSYPDRAYIHALEELLGRDSEENDVVLKSYDYGFSLQDIEHYPTLTEEWKQFIQERRLQKVGG